MITFLSLSSGMFEMERQLDRVECNITQYRIQGEPLVPVSQIAQRVSSTIGSSLSIFVLNDTAGMYDIVIWKSI